MEIRNFNPDKHIAVINSWLIDRKHPIILKEETPRIGFLAYIEDTPIACAFLRRVEGGFGQIDGLATNPHADCHLRNMAINGTITLLLNTAKSLKLKGLMVMTIDQSIVKRAEELGFVTTTSRLLIKDL